MSLSLRSCEVVTKITYLSGYPDNWRTELIKTLEANRDLFKNYAFILHDKDVDEKAMAEKIKENGVENIQPILKDPHIHLVLELSEATRASTIANKFGLNENCVERIKQKVKRGKRWFSDVSGALEYLYHGNAPTKFQYDISEIIVSDGFDIEKRIADGKAEREKMMSLVNLFARIEAGEIKKYQVVDHIGMDTYIENKRDIEAAFEYYQLKNKQNVDRDLTVYYISGASGVGKTSVAKYMAQKQGQAICISGANNDPLENYMGEEVLVLDELRPDTMTMDNLLKLIDKNTRSMAKSRYKNKNIEADTIVITSIYTLDEFYRKMQVKDEPIVQLKRRIAAVIEVDTNFLRFMPYDPVKKTHVLAYEAENPVTQMFTQEDQQKKTDSKVKELADLFGAKEFSLPQKSITTFIEGENYGKSKSTANDVAGTPEDDSDVPF